MADLQDLIKIWFHNSPHIKTWVLDHTQFVAKGPHSQKGYIFIMHDGVEHMRYHQYGGGHHLFKAADPEFFNNLDKVLKETLL